MKFLRLLLVLWLLPALASAEFDYRDFSKIPVQHEGRIKPLGSVASLYLERMHGSDSLEGKPAIQWMAETMFDPFSAMQTPLFSVRNKDTQAMLGLAPKKERLYSFTEIMAAFQAHVTELQPLFKAEPSQLNDAQHQLLELYDNASAFAQIARAMTLVLPLRIELTDADAKRLGMRELPTNPATFTDYAKHLPKLQQAFQQLEKRKGDNIQRYSDAEKRLALSAGKLMMIEQSTRDNQLLRLVPAQWGEAAWQSLWAIFHAGEGSPETAELMKSWRTIAIAHQSEDRATWNKTAAALQKISQHFPGVRPAALELEHAHHAINPLGKTLWLYALAFLCSLAAASSNLQRYQPRWLLPGIFSIAATLHLFAILARVFILRRPPVGTLYESMIFVALIAVLFCLYLERRLRGNIGFLAAGFAGFALLLLSQQFARGEDTLGVLVAVLNTNFWLATHVLIITAGYGFGIAASLLAHAYLLLRCKKSEGAALRQLFKGAHATALIALLFTSLGTLLGGIWADQSWGRFWGWDPKENGALLICLWLIWLLHGKISSAFRERGFAIALVLLNAIVAISWLGVNLLNTGLHSYGFTDKAAISLAAFCLAEVAYAGAAYFIIRRNESDA